MILMVVPQALAFGIMAIWIAAAPTAAVAACGLATVTVLGNEKEEEVACRALDDVRSYFAAIGSSFEPEVTISFDDVVWAGADQKVRVLGFYDRSAKHVHLTGWRSDDSTRKAWGIPWGPEMAGSIARHELVHMAVARVMAPDHGLSGAWHEFVAYAVQLELMPQDLRGAIFSHYPGITPFDTLANVNSILHAADPDSFGLKAFLLAEENGGPAFIRAIIQGLAGADPQDPDYLSRMGQLGQIP